MTLQTRIADWQTAGDLGSRGLCACCCLVVSWGAFQTGDYAEIMNKATCLSLLSNAVLIWNTVHMTRIVAQLRAAGETITDEELARISPTAFAHVIPNGTYFACPTPLEHEGNSNGHVHTPLDGRRGAEG
jgi:Tn3 transposase DDE domain